MLLATAVYLTAGSEALAGALARLGAPAFTKQWQCVLLLAAVQMALSQVRRGCKARVGGCTNGCGRPTATQLLPAGDGPTTIIDIWK